MLLYRVLTRSPNVDVAVVTEGIMCLNTKVYNGSIFEFDVHKLTRVLRSATDLHLGPKINY